MVQIGFRKEDEMVGAAPEFDDMNDLLAYITMALGGTLVHLAENLSSKSDIASLIAGTYGLGAAEAILSGETDLAEARKQGQKRMAEIMEGLKEAEVTPADD